MECQEVCTISKVWDNIVRKVLESEGLNREVARNHIVGKLQ